MSHSLKECFSLLEDPRIERHKRHKLLDIIILTICAVISGAEGWEAIEKFGEAKLNNAPAKSWWVCVSGLKVQPKHVGLTTCDRYQQTL